MRRLVNTSISLFFGLTMFQTFGAGCTARVQVGQAGPDEGAAGGVESSAGSGGAGGGFSSTSGSSSAVVGAGGFSSTSGSSSAVVGAGGFSSTSGSSSVVVGSSSVVAGAGGGDAAPTAGAIALFRGEFPGEPSNESGSSSSVGGGPGADPNDLFIIFGAPVSSCADPSYISCGSWMLAVSISPALQVPGIIDLSWPDPWSYYAVSGPGSDSGSCSFDAGYVTSGTMEIVSIDDAEVVVRLSDAVVRMNGGTDTDAPDANGEYTAALCP